MKIKLSDIVTLDYETFYSKEYSLSLKKYNTSSYIRDPQFYAQMVGIKDGTKKTVWYPHDRIAEGLHKHRVAERPVMCHNTSFDGFILSEHYDCIPPFYLDTLSMARGLHGTLSRNDLDTVSRLYGRGGKVKPHALKKVKGIRILSEHPELEKLLAEYMCGDTDECYAIGKMQLAVYPSDELELIDWTIRQFCDPVLRLDAKMVKEELEDEVSGKAAKQRAAMVPPEVLQSADRFAAALEQLGVEPPVKISNATGELTYAFAKNDLQFQELLEHDDERVVALVEARLATKSTIGETRARRMLELAGKPIPVGYNYCAAHTTRWGGTNKLNWQNMGRIQRDSAGKIIPTTGRLRRSIMAPPNHMLVVADSAQIEARTLAWLAGQDDVLERFATGVDNYKIMASKIYKVDPSDIDKIQRFVGKVAVLGLGYGMGANKFQHTLAAGAMGPSVELSDAESKAAVYAYRSANNKIKDFWKYCEDVILTQMLANKEGSYKCLEWDGESIWLPNGLGLHYYALAANFDERSGKYTSFKYQMRRKYVHTWGGTMTENITQALARVIIGEQLLIVERWLRTLKLAKGEYARVVMTTHDEIVACVPKRFVKEVEAFMLKTMSTPPKWAAGLPLSAETGHAMRYEK